MMVRRVKVAVILCAALAVILYLLSAFVLFKTESITVTGADGKEGSAYYSAQEIISASGVEIGSSLVNISKGDIEERIEKSLPYIGAVTVKRDYPSSLLIEVEDTSAYFALRNGNYILLNREFKVLETSAEEANGCAELVGVPIISAVAGEKPEFSDDAYRDRISALLSACENAELGNITKFDFSNIANVKFVIGGRITVTVGTVTNLSDKLSLAVKTISAETENNPNAHIIIDVTDTERAYVRDDTTPVEESTDEETKTDDYGGYDGYYGEPDEPDGGEKPEAVG